MSSGPLPPSRLEVMRDRTTTRRITVVWSYDKRKSHVENWKVQYTAKGNSDVKSLNTTSVDVLQKTIGGLFSGEIYTVFVYSMTTGGLVSQDAAMLDVTVSKCFHTPYPKK